MPVKKKRTGHTDYRTGGMFYSKFNKGGVSVAGVQEHEVDAEAERLAREYAKYRIDEERQMKDMDPLGRNPRNYYKLPKSEYRALRAAAGLPKNFRPPSDKARKMLKGSRFDTERKE